MDNVIAVAPLLLEYLTPLKAYNLVFRTNKAWYLGCHKKYIHFAILLARAKDILYNTHNSGASNSGLIFQPSFPINILKDYLNLNDLYAYCSNAPYYKPNVTYHAEYPDISVQKLYYKWPKIFIPRLPDFQRMDIKQLFGYIINFDPKGYKIPYYKLPKPIKDDPFLAISYDGKNIQHIPDNKRTQKLYEVAAKNGGIRWVPEHLVTKQMCIDAVSYNGMDLQEIPIQFRLDKDICKAAIAENAGALNWMTLAKGDPNVIEYLIIAASISPYFVLHDMPRELLTYEIYQMIVSIKGHLFQKIPKKYQTYELWLIAISNYFDIYTYPEYREFRNNNPDQIIPALIAGGGLKEAIRLPSFQALDEDQKKKYYIQSLRRNGGFLKTLDAYKVPITEEMKDAAFASRRIDPKYDFGEN
jgi:hypothetical protein